MSPESATHFQSIVFWAAFPGSDTLPAADDASIRAPHDVQNVLSDPVSFPHDWHTLCSISFPLKFL
jgi:hypothetical protein